MLAPLELLIGKPALPLHFVPLLFLRLFAPVMFFHEDHDHEVMKYYTFLRITTSVTEYIVHTSDGLLINGVLLSKTSIIAGQSPSFSGSLPLLSYCFFYCR